MLSGVTDLMAKKDVAIGDLLQLMEPVKNKESEVDACSDRVEAVQTQLDVSVAALRRHIDALKEIAVKQPEETSTNEAAAAGPEKAATSQSRPVDSEHQVTSIRAPSGAGDAGDRQMDKADRDEVADLRASLQSATRREKERVEALQSQLELARHELSECRSSRRLEQSALVTVEAQAMQLRTALACAEEDMKALRDALDQELLRGHRLQSRLMELDHTLHTNSLQEVRQQRESAPDRSNDPSRGSAPKRSSSGIDTSSNFPLKDIAFDDYMSGRFGEAPGKITLSLSLSLSLPFSLPPSIHPLPPLPSSLSLSLSPLSLFSHYLLSNQ